MCDVQVACRLSMSAFVWLWRHMFSYHIEELFWGVSSARQTLDDTTAGEFES